MIGDSIEKRGYPLLEEIKAVNGYPSEERFKKGRVAIVECIQQIPCNPCETACVFDAIHVGDPIINQPEVDYDKCIGCGNCVAKCPGLAIFMIDDSRAQEGTLISFPHEYLPLPDPDDTIQAVDRMGRVVCDGIVVRVDTSKRNEGTAVVTIKVPEKYRDIVRGMKRLTR